MDLAVGLDFGTTNSSLAIAYGENSVSLATFLHEGRPTSSFRSVLYFDSEDLEKNARPRAIAGPEAISRYRGSRGSGRLILSIKSHLASRHFTETRILGVRFTIEDLIAAIIQPIRTLAEQQFGKIGTAVTVGRPVRFAGVIDESGDLFAMDRLRSAVEKAGFEKITFQLEPVAAAYSYGAQLDRNELVLIADFGGGTSDFSLIRLAARGKNREAVEDSVLGNEGIAIGGDTLDSRIVRHVASPRLGLGSKYRSPFGQIMPVPSWIYEKLVAWHQLSFLKNELETLEQIRASAIEPDKIHALIEIVEEELGYDLYRAVERTKFTLSERELADFEFQEHRIVIKEDVIRSNFEYWIRREIRAIHQAVHRLLDRCSVTVNEVDRVFITGGSSLVPAVRKLFVDLFGADRLRTGQELTTVVKGLALQALYASR
jgi:hypothetical chaperone protein